MQTQSGIVRGLALGGGGVPGVAAHLGFMHGLADAGVKADVLAGLSAGGLIVGGLAAGMSLADLREGWRQLAADRWRLIPREALHMAEALRPGPTPGLLDLTHPIMFVYAQAKEKVSDWKEGHAVVASDVTNRRPVLIDQRRRRLRMYDDIRLTYKALVATAAFPFLFSGVRTVHGQLLVDGGLYSSTPVWAAEVLGATHTVAVHIGRSTQQYTTRDTTIEGLLWEIADQLQKRIPAEGPRHKGAGGERLDVTIAASGNLLTFDDWEYDYEVGFVQAQKIAKRLDAFWKGTADVS